MFRVKPNVQFFATIIATITFLVISWSIWEVVVQPDLGVLWTDQGTIYFAAPDSLLRVGDNIQTIDGVPLSESKFPYYLWQRGDIIQIGIERNGVKMELALPYINRAPAIVLLPRLSLIVVVLAFWGASMSVILFPSSSNQQSLIFFFFCQVLGISLALGNLTNHVWSAHLSLMLTSLAVALAIHFHLLFPINRLTQANQKWVWGIYAISLLRILPYLIRFNVIGLKPVLAIIYSSLFLYAWAIIGVVSILILLFNSYREAPSIAIKRQVGLVAISGTLAFIPVVTFSILPQIFGYTTLPSDLAFIFLIFIPVGYGYAITHYQFIKLERYASRSATAVFVICLLAFFYFGINALLQDVLYTDVLGNPLANVVIVMLMVTIYNPLHRRLRHLVDFLLYGGWYDYSSVVGEITHNLEHNNDIETLVATVSSTIQKSMRVYWAYLLWQEHKSKFSIVSIAGQSEADFSDIHFKDLPAITTYMHAQLHPATSQELREALSEQRLSPEESKLLSYHSVRLWVPIHGLQRSMGLLILGPKYGGDVFDESDMGILDMVSRQASIAFQNAQLIDELQAKAYENEQYKKKTIHAREEERKRIARELHDQVIQALVGLKYQVAHLQPLFDQSLDYPNGHQKVLDLQGEVGQLIQTTRSLCQNLRPAALDLGLIPSVRSLVSGFEMELGIEINLTLEGNRNIPIGEDIALCLFRCTGEALSNISKHAKAQEVFVKLCVDSYKVSLTVKDNGCGFQIPERLGSLMAQDHFGLVGMRERVELLRGEFCISSDAMQGTHLEVSIPLQNSDLKEE